MNAAATLLAQTLVANAAANYADIDRSADARAERARHHAYLARKNRIEGLPNPPTDSLEARLAQHHINGDISAAQLVAITRLLPR